jgi:hypothetical protein
VPTNARQCSCCDNNTIVWASTNSSVQGDPDDGLIYEIKNQTATLVLCALPVSRSTKRAHKESIHKSVRSKLDDPAEAADARQDPDQLQDVMPAANSPKWQAIGKSVGKYCFRLPGVCSAVHGGHLHCFKGYNIKKCSIA